MVKLLRLLRVTYLGWNRNSATLHAAGIAFYMLFSLAPLAMLFTIATLKVFTADDVEWRIVGGIEKQAGEPVATFVRDIAVSNQNMGAGWIATSAGWLLAVYGASAVFHQLQASIHAMWELAPRVGGTGQGILITIKGRLLSALIVLGIGLVLFASLLISALWTALPENYLDQLAPWLERFTPLSSVWLAPVVYIVVFALLFKTLPQATIAWSGVWPGALATALLFWLGSYVIRIYLANNMLASLYGASSSMILFLLWTYYSAWIILFGARFTLEYARQIGAPIQPAASMHFTNHTVTETGES